MRVCVLLVSLILLLLPAWLAGQKPPPKEGNSRAQQQFRTGPVTVQGCLTGSEGRYSVGTENDKLYVLLGNPTELQRYNGKLVRISGTQKPPGRNERPTGVLKYPPARLEVSKISKIADTCSGP